MRVSPAAALLFAAAVGCRGSLLSPRSNLDGQWEWQFNRNPSGSSISFSLSTAGSLVTGSGNVCGVGPLCSPGPVTVTGQCALASFQFTLRGSQGFLATYTGKLVGQNELTGVWTQGSDTNTVIFYRT